MRIYSIEPHDDVQLLDMDVGQQATVMRALGRGAAYEWSWRPLPVWRLKKPRKRRLEELCDLTTVAADSGVPAMSARAKRVLEPILGRDAEWLPLAFDEREYWLLNSLRVLDALDVPKASVTYFPDGRVSGIEAFAFKLSVIADEWLFKVSLFPYRVLVTDRFRSLVEREGLTGFHFQPIWDSDHKPFRAWPGREDIRSRPDVFGPDGFVTNYKEFWPPEWKEQARQTKRKAQQTSEGRS